MSVACAEQTSAAPTAPTAADAPHAPAAPPLHACVLDTNVVLDFWVFDHPPSAALRQRVEQGHTRWLATAAMRDELARVLTYPHLARRLAASGRAASAVLAAFDRHAHLLPSAPAAPYRCKDPDDQGFIDLAVQHRAALHSKDAQVLCMARRLARLGIAVNPPV